MRVEALRGAQEKGERLLNNPYHYKLIFNHLFVNVLCIPNESEQVLALEFWNLTKHLIEGKPLNDLPTKFLDKDALINKINKIIRGECVNIDEDEDS